MNKFYLESKYNNNFFQKSISLFLKISLVAFLFIAPKTLAQLPVTQIHTDWNGYFTSSGISGVAANQPSTENNLLAFSWNGKTWSTGANNAALIANSVIYEDSRFRALKIQSLVYDSSSYYLQGSMIDGSLTNRILTPPLASSLSTPAELASRLTDGINGLALGTGIANIKSTVPSEFKVGTNNIQLGVMGDNIPDIIVTQVASPSSTVDTFKFVDAAGVIVGNVVNVAFNSIAPVGTYRLDLFNTNNGAPATGFSANDTREIRILGMDLASFGIDNALAPSVDRFVVTFSGSSDCAFIAFNSNSMKIAQLSLVKKSSLAGCGKEGDVINYTFDVTNTGEVPVTNINVTDPMPGMVLSGNPAPGYSLAVGATITITGTYTITAADVAAGRVINTAKVTGIDPSLNVIEDISGQTNTDDIPTVTNLLPPPIIGVITNQTCNDQGSVVLSNLPSSGTWTLTRIPGGTITGTGTTTTITGLAPNTYTFRVSNGTCTSPPSANVVISGRVTKTWDGTAWSPSPSDVPTKDNPVIINGNYSASSNGDLDACSLTINSGFKLTIEAGKFVVIQNNLTVSTGATLDVLDKGSLVMVNDNGTVSGSGITNIHKTTTMTKKLDYVYWSTPVISTTIATTFSGWRTDRAFEYNNGWIYATAMTPAKGYIITVPNSAGIGFINFQGQVNNGVKKITGVTTSNFYLVGNPYPSAIDANAFLNQNSGVLDGTLYFWTHNTAIQLASGIGSGKAGSGSYAFTSDDYASYNLVGGVGTGYLPISGETLKPSGQIPSCQGFFASTKATITAPNEIVFNNSMRLGSGATKLDNSNFFRTKNSSAKTTTTFERHRIWLNLTNNEGAFKQTLIGYVSEATNGNESRFDGETMNGNAFVDFYSVNENRNLVIQGRALPFDENDQVAIGFKSSIAGEFSINIDEIDGVLTNQSVILEDKSTHTEFDLKTGNYTFNTTAGTFNDRFVLKYKKTETLSTGDFETQQNQVIVAVKNKQIRINSFAGNIKNVTVYDLLGRLIYEKDNVNSDELLTGNFVSNNQVLIVKTKLENDLIVTEKIVY